MHCLPFMGVEFEPMDSAGCSGRNTMIPLHVWSYDWRLKYWGRSHCSHTVPWLSSMGISWSVHPWAAQDAVTPWRSDFRVFFAHGSHRLELVRRMASAKFGVHRIKMVGHICIPDSENWFHLWLPVPWVSCWPLPDVEVQYFWHEVECNRTGLQHDIKYCNLSTVDVDIYIVGT